MKRIEGTSLEGVYEAFLSTSDNMSDMELATLEDWLTMMLRNIQNRRQELKTRKKD
jgi:hypothetical protein